VVPKGELRGGLKNFLQRRARRILPPYYAALALCLGLIYTVIGDWTGTLWDVPIKVKESPGTSILAHVLLLQDLFATSHINYVFWSIAVEWQIYFAMPILVWAWRKYGAGFVVGAALTLGYALMFGFSETRLERANPHYLGMFALGMLAAYVVRSEQPVFARLRERVPWAWLGLSAFLVAAGLVRYWGLGPSTSRFPYLDLPVGVMATALLISTSSAPSSLLERVFSFRPLVFVGTFSYSLYLIHAPLLQLLWQYGLNPLGLRSDALFLVLMTAGLALVLLCSYLFHLAFEAPFMRAASSERSAAPSPLPSR
jgi:peptidoglycan/LPS O-acetylase OafA/YrhL